MTGTPENGHRGVGGPPHQGQQGRQSDEVDRFFARERALVASQGSGDLHWQSIVRAARARRQSRLRGYLAGAAAAAVVVASVATGTALTRSAHVAPTSSAAGTSTPTQSLSATQPPATLLSTSPSTPLPTTLPTSVPTPRRTPSAAPSSAAPSTTRALAPTSSRAPAAPTLPAPTLPAPTLPAPSLPAPSLPAPTLPAPTVPAPSLPAPTGQSVPADFTVTSVSNAGRGVLYALGSASCAAARCPILVRSSDDGATWQTVHVFPSAAAGAAAGDPTAGADAAQAPGALTQVRFASPQVGWVFGGGAQVTRDGGRSWRDYPHVGEVVLSLETDGSTVVLAGASGCGAGVCSGPLSVSAVGVSAGEATSETGRGPAGGRLSGARVALDDGRTGQAYVTPLWTAVPAGRAQGARLSRSGLAPVAAPAGCAPGASADLLTTAGSPGVLLGVCAAQGAAGSVTYDVSRSTDGGATWTDIGPTLSMVNGADRSFAAADSAHLVAVSGDGAGQGSMMVSRDGGSTWTSAVVRGGVPRSGWRWVGAAGGGTYYAVAVDAAEGFWRSTDYGAHWSRVTVR